MYHGHLGISKTEGLFGLLIAQETKASVPFPVPYTQDLPLVLSDWYHLGIDEQVLHRTGQKCIALCCTVLHCTALNRTLPYKTLLYCTETWSQTEIER